MMENGAGGGSGGTRRIAGLIALDVVGYSRLMAADERGTLARVLALRREIVEPAVAAQQGRLFKHMGDGALAEFPSVVGALEAARAIQDRLARQEAVLPEADRLRLRIGVHLGDVIVEGDDLFGEGVNIAARLEPLAPPGGIALSGPAFDQVKGRLGGAWHDRGPVALKNIAEPVRVITLGGQPRRRSARLAPRRLALLAASFLLILAAAAAWLLRDRLPGMPGAGGRGGPPLVAVMPFGIEPGAAVEPWFGDALAVELAGALSRFVEFRVLAPEAASRLRERAGDLEALRRELNASYLVTGSVRGGEALDVGVQLTNLADGAQAWARRFAETGRDRRALEPAIAQGIAGALAQRIGRLEETRARGRVAGSADAYDLYLHARALMMTESRRTNREAREALTRAVELDPGFAPAWADLAFAEYLAGANGWTEFRGLDEAEAHARRAIELDPELAAAWRSIAFLSLQRGLFDQAVDAADRALAFNPSDLQSLVVQGGVLMWSGRSADAIATFAEARRLDPELGVTGRANLGMALVLEGRDEEALRWLEPLAVQPGPPVLQSLGRIARIAAYTRLGRKDDSDREIAALRRTEPFFSLDGFTGQFRDAGDGATIDALLRRAGLGPPS